MIYVARQMGHDAKLTLSTYGHVIDELEDAPRVSAEDAIRAARESSCVTGVSRRRSDEACRESRSGRIGAVSRFVGEPSAGLEPATPSLPWKCSTS